MDVRLIADRTVWVEGYLKNKDGEWGKRKAYLYSDWKKE